MGGDVDDLLPVRTVPDKESRQRTRGCRRTEYGDVRLRIPNLGEAKAIQHRQFVAEFTQPFFPVRGHGYLRGAAVRTPAQRQPLGRPDRAGTVPVYHEPKPEKSVRGILEQS